MEASQSLVRVLTHTLGHMQAFLQQIPAKAYAQPLEIFNQSSTGQHTRHVIEFLQCLIQQCQCSGNVVNYEKRIRDKAIEQEPAQALAAIDEIIHTLETTELPRQLVLETQYAAHLPVHRIDTTLERELIYNIEHAIHHLAMIRIGLQIVAPDLDIARDFGVAPSTLRYRKHSA